MITCLVCKELKSEGYFVELRHGGLAICSDCRKTPEAEKLREEAEKQAEKIYNEHMEYEQKRQQAKRNELYEGQYDWM